MNSKCENTQVKIDGLICKQPARGIPDDIHHVFASRYLCNKDDGYSHAYEHPLAKAHKIILLFKNTS